MVSAGDKRRRASRALSGFRAVFFIIIIIIIIAAAGCVVLPDPGGNLEESGVIPLQGDTSANPSQYAAFVATTDFQVSGGFGVIDLDTREAYLPDPATAAQAVSPDPVATAFGDYIFVINRYTYDNISVLDKRFRLVRQYSVADACDPSNPHDLAFKSQNLAYLSRYACRDLWVLDPVSGRKLGSVDLTAAGFGGADGIPDMSGLLLMGDTLFVAVQNLDRFLRPTDKSYLAAVDTNTDSVVAGVELVGVNPATDVVYSSSLDRILVACAGSFYTIGDGGIEAVNPHTLVSEGFIVSEAGLGGEIADFEIVSSSLGYATITDSQLRSKLVSFNPSTGELIKDPVYMTSSDFSLWDLAVNDRGELYLCDRTATRPGILVFDTKDNDRLLTPQPIYLGLPPFSIVFLK